MNTPVTIIIHTLNEEENLPHALDNVIGWANQVCVVDSESTDRTQAIAREKGAELYSRTCTRQGLVDQRNWALSSIPFQNEWVFVLDADEIMEESLKSEVGLITNLNNSSIDGYWCRWKAIFMGRWIKHASMYPTWSLRLFRHRVVRYEQREVNSHPLVSPGRSDYLKNHILHIDHRGFTNYLKRLDEFSTLESRAYYRTIHRTDQSNLFRGSIFGSVTERRRFFKNIFIKLPFRPLIIFSYLYIGRLGFLDGRAGFDFCLWKALIEWSITLKMMEIDSRRKSE